MPWSETFRARTLVLFSSLGLLLILTGCPQKEAARTPQRRTVRTERVVALGDAQATSAAPEYIATVRANEETDFSFKVGGIVELIGPQAHQNWDEGSEAKAGTVLARLQQGDFKNALASAKASADFAAANNERLRKLLASNVVSK